MFKKWCLFFLFNLVFVGCTGIRYEAKKSWVIKKSDNIAVLLGKGERDDIQKIIIERFCLELSSANKFNIVPREEVQKILGSETVDLELPMRSSLLEKAPDFKDCNLFFANDIGDKLKVDAFVVIWIFDWYNGDVPKTVKVKKWGRWGSKSGIKRDVVAQMFSTKKGEYLWHCHYRKTKSYKEGTPQEVSDKEDVKDAGLVGKTLAQKLAKYKSRIRK